MRPVEFASYRKRRVRRKRSHRHGKGRGALKAVGIIALILVMLTAAGAGGFVYLRTAGRKSLQASAATTAPNVAESQDASGFVSRNGKKYAYNQDMINILCMGIDRNTELVSDKTEIGDNGQADTIFLLALNQRENTMKILGISRDTMTDVKAYDSQGNYVGKSKNHLGLAFSYGDGAARSGELMVEAVSNLLYELPVHGYAAVNMNAIQTFNDAVGGVTVTLSEEMNLGGEIFAAGSTLTLNGAQAESFVRSRDMDREGSNNLRMMRQKQYALAFITAAQQRIKKNPAVITELYGSLTADMTTSIGLDEAVYLASLLPGMQFQIDDIQMLQGDTKQGTVYEEFYVDDEALLDTVLEVFYQEVV